MDINEHRLHDFSVVLTYEQGTIIQIDHDVKDIKQEDFRQKLNEFQLRPDRWPELTVCHLQTGDNRIEKFVMHKSAMENDRCPIHVGDQVSAIWMTDLDMRKTMVGVVNNSISGDRGAITFGQLPVPMKISEKEKKSLKGDIFYGVAGVISFVTVAVLLRILIGKWDGQAEGLLPILGYVFFLMANIKFILFQMDKTHTRQRKEANFLSLKISRFIYHIKLTRSTAAD